MTATETRVQDLPPFAGHSPERDRPLGWYALLISTYASLLGGFVTWFRRSGRVLPERMEARDFALISVAAHKGSRLLGKARITSALRAPFTRYQQDGGPAESEEAARGRGLRRVIGELLICPFCLSMWFATLFTAALLVAPRPTRWVASLLAMVFASDVLHLAYRKAEDSL
jgi:membrane protein YqaA with SNARE-associated domain